MAFENDFDANQAQQWLGENHCANDELQGYRGTDLFAAEKRDLQEWLGKGKGAMLYNRIHQPGSLSCLCQKPQLSLKGADRIHECLTRFRQP
jgi:hypothetical protein